MTRKIESIKTSEQTNYGASRLPALEATTPCRGTTAATPPHPNQLLLTVCPELRDFWDGGAWNVTAERLEKAAARAGIEPMKSQSGEVFDLFTRKQPYDLCERERVVGAGVARHNARHSEVLLVDELLGPRLTETLELQSYSKDGPAAYQPLEAHFEVVSLQVVPPHGIRLDRTLAGNSLLERIVPIRNESLRSIADKVAQRNLVGQIDGIAIEQPRYADVRSVNPPDAYADFAYISFANFPLGEISSTTKNAKKIWVFEDCRQGFAVVSDGKRQYVHSEHGVVQDLIKRNHLQRSSKSCETFVARLERFLGQLSEHPRYGVCLLRHCPPREAERLNLARSILAYRGEVFVKSSRSSDGILVLQVNNKPGCESVVQSDSPEVGELLKQYLSHIDSARSAAGKKALEPLTRVAIDEEIRAVRKRASLDGFLAKAISCMEAPIVEEAIPVARLAVPQGFEKVECRLIFQGKAQVELVGHYVKASLNRVAANIGSGGHSRRTHDVIYGLHRQYLDGLVSTTEIDKRASKSFEVLQEQGTKLARACADHYRALRPQRPLCDFALDICPVWDRARGTLRFVLLEIQFTYGFSGLTNAQPVMVGPTAEDLMAHRISRFKLLNGPEEGPQHMLRQIEANFEMLRTQLGLSDSQDAHRPRHLALQLLQRRLLEDL